MTTIALIFLLLLHFRSISQPLSRIEVAREGLWWVTWYESGKGSSLIYRWPWRRRKRPAF